MVKAEVLKSWPLDQAELTFIQKLKESRRNEMRGRFKNTTLHSLVATPKVPTVFSKACRIYSKLIVVLMDLINSSLVMVP